MGNLHHINVFSDLGEHYIQGEDLGEIYHTSILRTSTGTHIVTSAKGCIYTFLQEDGTTTGSRAIKTDSISSTCCALCCSTSTNSEEQAEKMVILGAVGTTVQIMEADGGDIRQPYTADLKAPEEAASLMKYFPLKTDDGYKILTLYQNNDMKSFSLGYFELINGRVTNAADTGITATSQQVGWVRSQGEDCVLYESNGASYIDTPLPSYDKCHKIKRLLLGGGENAAAVIGAFENLYFLIDNDGVLTAYDLENFECAGGTPLMTVRTNDPTISELHAFRTYGMIQLLAFSPQHGRLYHCSLSKQMTGAEDICIPLAEDVLQYSVDSGETYMRLSLVCGKTAHPQLVQYSLSDDGSEWKSSRVYFQSQTNVQSVQGHIVDIALCQADGTPSAEQAIKLWSSEETTLFYNGNVLRTGPNTPYIISSDIRGMIELVKEGDSLDMPPLIIQQVPDGADAAGSYFMVTPGEKYKDKFKNLSGDDLDHAVTATGERLVDGDFDGQRSEVLSSASDALGNMLSGTSISENQDLIRIKEKDWCADKDNCLKVTSYSEDPTPYVGKLPKSNGLKSCIISFSGGAMSYRAVTPKQAQQHMRNTYRSVYGPNASWGLPDDLYSPALCGASNGLFSAIASLFKAIKNGIVKVAEVVIHAAETAITATIRFIDNALEQVAKFVVNTIKEAVSLVEGVLKQIEVGVKKVIQWVGFMLDWGDIQNTAKFVEKKMEEGFDSLDKLLDKTLESVESGIDNAYTEITEAFKRFNTDLPGDNMKESAQKPPEDSPMNQADAHNIIKKNICSDDIELQINALGISKEEEDAFATINSIGGKLSDVCALDLSEMFDSIKGSKVSLKAIGNCLIHIVEASLKSALVLAKDVLRTLFDAIKVVIRLVRKFFTVEIHIPLISALIKKVTGMELTLLNLAGFAIALPLTVAYKLIYHKAPVGKQTFVAAENNQKVLHMLALFGISLACVAKTATAGCMCIKKKSPIKIPSTLGMLGVICFLPAASTCLSPNVSVPGFAVLLVACTVTLACDYGFAAGCFKPERNYYNLVMSIAAFQAVLVCFLMMAGKDKAVWSLCTPGGLMFAVQTMMCCMFYRNWSGENKIAVAICGLFGVLAATMTPFFMFRQDDAIMELS